MPKARVLPLLFILGLVASLPLAGQQKPTSNPPASNAPQDSSQDQDQSMETLKVRVNVVQLFYNVKDKKGGLIPSLTKDDFELFEDGKPQTIK